MTTPTPEQLLAISQAISEYALTSIDDAQDWTADDLDEALQVVLQERGGSDEEFIADSLEADWGEDGFEERKMAAADPETCLLCQLDISDSQFSKGLVGRCPGEVFGGLRGQGQSNIDHGEYIFFHFACTDERPRCPVCTIPLADRSWIVTSKEPGDPIEERWDSPRFTVNGWRGTGVRQSTPQTCYAGALAAALNGLGFAISNDSEMVHRWACNEAEGVHPNVDAYQERVRLDRAAHPHDTFAQMFPRISTWPEWDAVRAADGAPTASAAPGLDPLQAELQHLSSPSAQEIVGMLKMQRVLLVASFSHWQVVYGYTVEATTGAVKALVWDPKGSYKELFLTGGWFDDALVIRT